MTPIKKPEKKRKRQSSPFRRVKTEEIKLMDDRLGDRMAEDCLGGVIGWGKRAHEQLKAVKGKKFTVCLMKSRNSLSNIYRVDLH